MNQDQFNNDANNSGAAYIFTGFDLNLSPPLVGFPVTPAIGDTTATIGGRVTSEGSAPVSGRGIVYSLLSVNPSPELGGVGVTQVSTDGSTGPFTINLTGLASKTTYIFRACAINIEGIGYSDTRTFRTGPYKLLTDAVNTPVCCYTQGGDAYWFPQTAFTFDGMDAARSGPIGHNLSSAFSTVVEGPGTSEFRWAVSSQAGGDFLRFYINGIGQAAISGEQSCSKQGYEIPPGCNILSWAYTKNASISQGFDAGWIDRIQWSSTAGFPGWAAAAGTAGLPVLRRLPSPLFPRAPQSPLRLGRMTE